MKSKNIKKLFIIYIIYETAKNIMNEKKRKDI